MISIAKVVLISCLSWKVLCEREPSIVYKMKNIECITIPGFSANASCFIKAINWNKAVAEMDVDLVRPLYNISVRLQVFKKDYSNQFQPFLIDVHINICDILSRRSFGSFGVMMLRVTKRFSNFNHSCPYEGHLFARGFYIDETLIPASPPLGFYKFNITIMENYLKTPAAHVGGIVWHAQIMQPVKKKIKQATNG
ncbi:uncharacterized protein [Drosophila kikkawai]|uniref:Uncharacterized protein n=1 Tax=Drosophila kikkawai TaxID=30033 RepID=A0A6P4ILG0_DROKI|nr:uncharacterized protein LOC108076132 [Drosophila kikkawai]